MLKRARRLIEKKAVRHLKWWRRRRAQQWLEWFRYEIHGSGLRYEFDFGPDSTPETKPQDLAAEYREDLPNLRRRIDDIERFFFFLAACRPFEFTAPAQSWVKRSEPFTYKVTPEALRFLSEFHRTLGFYYEVVSRRHDHMVVDATESVAGVINPDEWRNVGVAVHQDLKAHAMRDVISYLTCLAKS